MDAYLGVIEEARQSLLEAYHAESGRDGWVDVKRTKELTVIKVDTFRGRERDCTRSSTVVNAPVHMALFYLMNDDVRKEYDPMMDKIEDLEVFDKATKLFHRMNKSPNSWVITPRDFCLFRRIEKWKDGEIAVMTKSCENANCPEQKAYVRGLMLLNGFVLKDLSTTSPSFELTFAVQFDPQGKIPEVMVRQMGGRISSMVETIKDKVEKVYQREMEKKGSGQASDFEESALAFMEEIFKGK